jgi:hypothetical protein
MKVPAFLLVRKKSMEVDSQGNDYKASIKYPIGKGDTFQLIILRVTKITVKRQFAQWWT